MGQDFQALISQLEHEDYHIRLKAVSALGNSGDERVIPYLLRMLGDFDIHDEESKVNKAAALHLAHFGEVAFQPLCAALQPNPHHPKDSWRRYWVLDAFGFLGDRRAVDVIIRTMEASNDREIIEGASAALSRLGDTKAIEPIRRTLTRLKVQKTSPGYWETALNAALKSLGES